MTIKWHHNPDRPAGENPELHLLYWGKEDCAPRHSWGPGVRDHYKLHIVHKGKGIVKTGGHIYNLTEGHAFLQYPHKVIFYQADEAEPWTYSWIGFDGLLMETILSRTFLSPERPVLTIDSSFMPNLYNTLNEAFSDQPGRDLRLTGLLYRLMAGLVEATPTCQTKAGSAKPKEAYVQKGAEYIHVHYNEAVTVEQIAGYLGLNRKYVSALFKDVLGMSPQQYLLRYRMNKAAGLLKDGSLTVGEVARSVGYKDPLLFSRMFKQVMGASPTRYRS